jgi:hypothetical protein
MENQVLISIKHINQQQSSKKLANKYLGSVPITKVIGNHRLAYKMKLPEEYKMHDSFSVSLLEFYKRRNGEIIATQDL